MPDKYHEIQCTGNCVYKCELCSRVVAYDELTDQITIIDPGDDSVCHKYIGCGLDGCTSMPLVSKDAVDLKDVPVPMIVEDLRPGKRLVN